MLETSERPSRGRTAIWVGVATLIVVAGVLASVLGARGMARSNAAKARTAFRFASEEIASSLRVAISHEEDLVVDTSAYVKANPGMSPATFDSWVESVNALQRFPELQNVGFVKLVPAAELAAFEARMAANPVRAFGARSQPVPEPPRVLPDVQRPFYCLAVVGMARNVSAYVPAGLNYCALAPTMTADRDAGLANYAPVAVGTSTTLGVSTPVYRGGAVPATVSGRRRAFMGWLGELIVPDVVLRTALEGHPDVAVKFQYRWGSSHVAFSYGAVPAHADSTIVNVHKGWTLQSFTPAPSSSVFHGAALTLLIGGSVLSAVIGLLLLVLATGRGRAMSLVREKTRELSHLALHDTLTGLPNRALVLDRAEQLLARVARERDSSAGALFIDLDGFKDVNDNLGHAAGDALLKAVGARLQAAVREQDTVGRLGGDEFVVLVQAGDEAALHVLADRLIAILREPVEIAPSASAASVTASIGIAFGRYETPDALLRDADLALYSAKAAGRDRHVLFDTGSVEAQTGPGVPEQSPTS